MSLHSGIDYNQSLYSTKFMIDQNLSVYIPFVAHENASEEYIKKVFSYLDIGSVKRVDFQPKYTLYSNNPVGKIAFVHMVKWNENTCVENLQDRIMGDQEQMDARIVHDDPHYWILKRNNRPIPENYAENAAKLMARIDCLEKKNVEFETAIGHMQWWIRLHDSTIHNLCKKYDPDITVQATVVSQPSTSSPVHYNTDMFDKAWSKRLRKRAYPVNYEENSDVDETGLT